MNAYSRSLELNAARDIFQIALDDVSVGAFVLGERGLLLFANQAGQRLLDDRTWLRLERGRLAVASNAVGSAQLVRAIKQLVAQGTSFTREVRSRGERAVLAGGPVSGQHALASRVRALGLIWLLTMKPSADAIRLATQLYRLTAAEQRMLCLLSEGHDLARITRLLGVKQTTLRTQLRSIFTKTGCRRQSELLALVSRLSLLARAAAHSCSSLDGA